MKLHPLTMQVLTHSVSVVIGVVLVWRGIWYVLDGLDKIIFGGSHIITSVGGILLGLLILYLPDNDLKELSRL